MMQDEQVGPPETQQVRAPWVEPALSRLVAGAAELLTGSDFDNADES